MKVRHVLGISGGKDSTALAVYMKKNYPQLDIEYYFCDTDNELDETYTYIANLENYLGKAVKRLPEKKDGVENIFKFELEKVGYYLPSARARWCTVSMKLRPFEIYVGQDNVISYVGIRGDEERSAYISKKPNIQSIMPFRKNIWSDDVISTSLGISNYENLIEIYKDKISSSTNSEFYQFLVKDLSVDFDIEKKASVLLDIDTVQFNRMIYEYLKTTNYPLAFEDDFPVINNTERLDINDIVNILEDEGLGMPSYYDKLPIEVDGKKGFYNRSRSGCFFCFFQQRIEWVWLLEQHPDLYQKAIDYEKEGYTWIEGESLEEFSRPERVRQVKLNYLEKMEKQKSKHRSNLLMDNLLTEDEEMGCSICVL